jgi:signal transduction histidine kinase
MARSALAFAGVALVLTACLSVMTYELTRYYLLDQRSDLAVRQALLNAQSATRSIRRGQLTTIVQHLPRQSGSSSLLQVGPSWYAASTAATERDIPPTTRRAVKSGRIAQQRRVIHGIPSIVVGVPLRSVDAYYFEVFPLGELRNTLNAIAIALGIAAVATTVLGAVLGYLVSRRVMRPLTTIGDTARELQQGRSDVRLPPTQDPDLARVVETFNGMVDTLAARAEQERRFAADVAHELRTPLTSLSTAVDVVARRASSESAEAVAVVKEQVERFQRLVLDLLEISRFDGSQEQLHNEPVAPAELVRAVIDRHGFSGVPMEVAASTPSVVQLDKRRVDQILANLLENAEQHAGGPSRVSVGGSDTTLAIAVEDDGPGIPDDERTTVFERFHRGATDTGGHRSGLGLALVAEHTKLQGGTVRVEQTPSGGARFVVELPVGK